MSAIAVLANFFPLLDRFFLSLAGRDVLSLAGSMLYVKVIAVLSGGGG
jgi:hypothetical protein